MERSPSMFRTSRQSARSVAQRGSYLPRAAPETPAGELWPVPASLHPTCNRTALRAMRIGASHRRAGRPATSKSAGGCRYRSTPRSRLCGGRDKRHHRLGAPVAEPFLRSTHSPMRPVRTPDFRPANRKRGSMRRSFEAFRHDHSGPLMYEIGRAPHILWPRKC